MQVLTSASIVPGALYEERQFIIVPGEANVTVSNQTTTTGTIDKNWLECNKGTKVHVFDTYDWEFKPEFDPDNKGSKVPAAIVKLVGGSATGGATLHQPKAGWDSPALGPIFLTRNELLPDLPITTTGLNSTSSAAPDTAKSNNSVIIGGVAGGFCALALAVGTFIFFWKKRQVSGKSSQGESIAEFTAELHAADFRAELPWKDHQPDHYNTPHELDAYEPQEMGVELKPMSVDLKPIS